ncbi:hypothetical protein HU200_011171 [Digitaria exilis]|uniref:Uncharacterized protein n=1 Tax=Digitaria exilis TaxID=1010633 RepID=A0A835KP75_9POAL|nr:hypothetical protein HU200_011171 [Digitaria exilis]
MRLRDASSQHPAASWTAGVCCRCSCYLQYNKVNYHAVAADVISKVVIVAVIACWARFAPETGGAANRAQHAMAATMTALEMTSAATAR